MGWCLVGVLEWIISPDKILARKVIQLNPKTGPEIMGNNLYIKRKF